MLLSTFLGSIPIAVTVLDAPRTQACQWDRDCLLRQVVAVVGCVRRVTLQLKILTWPALVRLTR